jgi:cyanobactin maturation PatA/PatG family protease
MPDLTDITGIPELWTHTLGDPRITIAVLDGPVDLERACFRGANITKLYPYWQEELEEIDDKYIELFLNVQALEKKLAVLEKTDDAAAEESEEKSDKEADIKTLEEEIQAIYEAIPEPILPRLHLSFHATHISSTIFGQHGSPVEGIAPNCRGINIPISFDIDNFISPLNLTRAINLALESGANIIHIAACHPTQTGVAHDIFARAVRQCQENNVLIVAPGGNDKGECWCIPAVLPGVLTVGAMKDDGQPFKFSNWGGRYQEQGVMAPGEDILGAQPGTDEPIRKKGTSCAAPIITGVAALLLSLQLKRGTPPDPEAVRAAILNSAIPCDPAEVEEPERCLLGKLNIPGAVRLLTRESLATFAPSCLTTACSTSPPTPLLQGEGCQSAPTFPTREGRSFSEDLEGLGQSQPSTAVTASATLATCPSSSEPSAMPNNHLTAVTASQPSQAITASAPSNLVYALGTLGYDFGSEARRDSFKQLMPAVNIDGTLIPANPYDARQIVDYLAENLSEAKSLIWTLNLELTPIYAIEPKGAFAADVYETLQQILAGQVQPEDSEDFIERVSMPGLLTNRTVKLFSGQIVPVIEPQNTRGMYGWKVNSLISAAVETVRSQAGESNDQTMQRSLGSFLQRIYYDLRNLGQTSRDRALNFAATNAFQAASTFAQAVAIGMELDSIEVEKSPFCRQGSDCWDVKLKFFDPENSQRAKKVFRFTIDVSDILPITLGEVRFWSTP